MSVPTLGLPKWSWACRSVDPVLAGELIEGGPVDPAVGDAALVQVLTIGHHTRIATAEGEKLRLYPDDMLAGVFGNRYATDAFEAEVTGTADLHLLTDAGMIGTVRSRHRDIKPPTRLKFVGYLRDPSGQRANIKRRLTRRQDHPSPDGSIVLVIGTGMNSGKTTTASKLVKALLRKGLRIAACKLTGSVCPRDRGEFSATGVEFIRDFSDYGFPSTYLASESELITLFEAMVADAARTRPDVLVMEIADGILQRETRLLLANPELRRYCRGVVLAAPCAPSALFGVSWIQGAGHRVLAVSGRITNSPLFMAEYAAQSPVPVASSTGDCLELADLILHHHDVAP